MFKQLWDGIKGLLGGRGTVQIGSGNRSISDVKIGDNARNVVIGNTVHVNDATAGAGTPEVELGLALTLHPLRGMIHFLCITLLNKSSRTIYVSNFMLETTDHQRIYCKQDCITGEPQYKREVRPGDKAAFHIDTKALHEIGRPASDYICAAVDDVIGPTYRSETKKLQRCIADLLKGDQ